jgi:hypothetical protein
MGKEDFLKISKSESETTIRGAGIDVTCEMWNHNMQWEKKKT